MRTLEQMCKTGFPQALYIVQIVFVFQKLKCASHLLDKLVLKEHLNALVVNLYAGNQGYSLMLKGRSGGDSETICLPYEESELLDYIDAEQLPPLLVDLLDRVQVRIQWYFNIYCSHLIKDIFTLCFNGENILVISSNLPLKILLIPLCRNEVLWECVYYHLPICPLAIMKVPVWKNLCWGANWVYSQS